MRVRKIPCGILNSLKSSLKRASFTKSLNTGKAALDPVSYFPSVFGESKPTYTPITKFEV